MGFATPPPANGPPLVVGPRREWQLWPRSMLPPPPAEKCKHCPGVSHKIISIYTFLFFWGLLRERRTRWMCSACIPRGPLSGPPTNSPSSNQGVVAPHTSNALLFPRFKVIIKGVFCSETALQNLDFVVPSIGRKWLKMD